jgi:hypothetical protein
VRSDITGGEGAETGIVRIRRPALPRLDGTAAGLRAITLPSTATTSAPSSPTSFNDANHATIHPSIGVHQAVLRVAYAASQ